MTKLDLYMQCKVCSLLQKAINVIHHANNLKEKDHMIFSINAKKGVLINFHIFP